MTLDLQPSSKFRLYLSSDRVSFSVNGSVKGYISRVYFLQQAIWFGMPDVLAAPLLRYLRGHRVVKCRHFIGNSEKIKHGSLCKMFHFKLKNITYSPIRFLVLKLVICI